ncbi:carbonic anhydrase 6 [Artibeus jamaicensis]|uniref:carbonic anhydrase 6 n=1 Tax=Artibeus jamaicensis TaxID=9417 RepID=UPI00235B0FA1|nr:carbonic anhydrase 6 [Artibeus jamaicensis]
MLPQNLNNYYTYPGSFSTPPCLENVQWFVLEDTVLLSTAQIAELENSLLDNQNKVMQDNHRRTQPLNGRVVEASFMCQPDAGSELQYCLSEINRNLKDLRSYVEDKKA